MPWSASWAWWSTSGVHRLLSGHTNWIQCTAVGELDGRPVAVTGSVDGTALVWDLVSQRKIGEALPVGVAVSAIAIGDLGDYTVVLTGGEDGSVRIWDLSAGQEYGRPLTGHTNRVESIAVGTLGDHPVVLTASADGTARIWDLGSRRQLGKPLSAHRRTVNDADLGELDGRPVAITGGDDQAVYVWDLSGLLDGGDARVDGSPLLGSAGAVTAVSVARRGDRTVALVGDSTGLLSCWDLLDRRQLGEPVVAHNSYTASGVHSVVTGRFKARAVALTCGSEDVRLWDLNSLQQIGQPLRGHVEHIMAAALVDRADASLAVTVSGDRTARIWDLTTEQPEEGHIREVVEMAYCDVRGRPLLITGAEDGTARFWDLRTRHQAGPPMEGHSGSVQAVALHTSGGRVIAATGGADTTVRLWDPFSGAALGVLTGHTNVVTCVAIGELDGEPVVVSGSEDGTVRIWDIGSGAPLGPPIAGHIGGVQHLALRQSGPNLDIVLATSSGHCYYREVAGPGRYAHLSLEDYTPSAGVVGVAFHGDRPVVLCSLEGHDVHMLDATSMAAVAGPFHGHTEMVLSSALGRVGGKAVVATKSYDDTVRLWDLATATALGPPLEADNQSTAAPVFGQIDGVPVAVVAHRRMVRIWDVASARPMGEPLCGVDWRAESASIFRTAADRAVVAVEDHDGVIRTHDLDDGRQVADPITAMADFGLGMTTAPILEGSVLVRSGRPGTEVWSLADRKRIATRPGSSTNPRVHTMDGGSVVVSVGGDYELHAWDLDTQIPVCKTMTGHTAGVASVRTWTYGEVELAASASSDGTVRLWDLRTGSPWGEPLTGHETGARAIEFARLDRDILVSGAGDGRLRFWDLADRRDTGVELETFPSSITAIRVAHIGGSPILVAGDRYGQMRLWDTRSPRWNLALDIGSGIRDIALDEDGRVCVATDMGVVALRVNIAAQAKELSAG
ncbi:WD40 repeat domain-containing protein [Streptomyces sp. NPDC059743]|uniref:WD40 repeat domain-containing protein n=1 Tax=Streptomyces sp. NPDC059743 TaxID=3346928 RepID=UPI00366624B1